MVPEQEIRHGEQAGVADASCLIVLERDIAGEWTCEAIVWRSPDREIAAVDDLILVALFTRVHLDTAVSSARYRADDDYGARLPFHLKRSLVLYSPRPIVGPEAIAAELLVHHAIVEGLVLQHEARLEIVDPVEVAGVGHRSGKVAGIDHDLIERQLHEVHRRRIQPKQIYVVQSLHVLLKREESQGARANVARA